MAAQCLRTDLEQSRTDPVFRDEEEPPHGGRDSRGDISAAFWPDPFGQPIFLPQPYARIDTSHAYDVNARGLVVGSGIDHTSNLPYGFETAGVMWWPAGVPASLPRPFLLDDFVGGQTDLHVENLFFVNDQGRIAGTGRRLIFASDGGVERSARIPIIIDVLQYPDE